MIDAKRVMQGETCCTTAHITEAVDYGYAEISRIHGQRGAELVWQSQTAASRFIQEMVQSHRMDCDYTSVDGYLFLHPADDIATLQGELKTLHDIGWTAVSLIKQAPAPFRTGPCLRFPNQAQFHPLKYLKNLLNLFKEKGGVIFENVPVKSIHRDRAVTSSGQEIKARDIIVATHSPIVNKFFFVKQAAYRSYVIGLTIPKGNLVPALYWDTGHPQANNAYHYVRQSPFDDRHDLLIVGGEDHKTGQASDQAQRYERLETWARAHFPVDGPVRFQWSGQIIEPIDAIPYIGPSPHHDHIFLATGYSGNGITNATIAALLLTDLLTGIKNEWTDIYRPTRKTLGGLKDFVKENLDTAREFVEGRVEPDISHAESLKAGEGGIFRNGLGVLAVYRNDDGALSTLSAVCTHLGCIVQWNPAEKTFDCPCHGSRFRIDGSVVTGPALKNLKPQ